MRTRENVQRPLKLRDTLFAQGLEALMRGQGLTVTTFTEIVNAHLGRPDRKRSAGDRTHVEKSWISQYLSGSAPDDIGSFLRLCREAFRGIVPDECWDAVRDLWTLEPGLRRVYTTFDNMDGFGPEMRALFDQNMVDVLRHNLMKLGLEKGEPETCRQHYIQFCAQRRKRRGKEPRQRAAVSTGSRQLQD